MPHVFLIFLIFVVSELLDAKTEESKLYIYIYIYNEKLLHILEMYDLKKCKLIHV